jgi:hypothetical protein
MEDADETSNILFKEKKNQTPSQVHENDSSDY